MRLIAYRNPSYDKLQAVIEGYICCPQLSDLKIIELVIDSGTTTTTLAPPDVLRLGINWKQLATSTKMYSIHSSATAKVLHDVELWFPAYTGPFNRKETVKAYMFKYILLVPPQKSKPVNPDLQSILGMDFLSQFKKWKWTDNELFLDT